MNKPIGTVANAKGASDAFFNMLVKPADQKLVDEAIKTEIKYLVGGGNDNTSQQSVSLKTVGRAIAVQAFFRSIISTTKDKDFRKGVKTAGKVMEAVGKGASAIKN